MKPADIDALVAQAQAAKTGTAAPSAAPRAGAPAATYDNSTQAQSPDFAELAGGIGMANEVPLAMLMDLTFPVSIELGRTSMTVQEILKLGRGSVIQLERLAGEPIDIFIGDRRFAEGEVVVLGEHFGVRITRILAKAGVAGAAA